MFALNVLTSAVLWILGDPEGLHIDLFALSVNIPTRLLTLTNVLYLFCEMMSHFMRFLNKHVKVGDWKFVTILEW